MEDKDTMDKLKINLQDIDKEIIICKDTLIVTNHKLERLSLLKQEITDEINKLSNTNKDIKVYLELINFFESKCDEWEDNQELSQDLYDMLVEIDEILIYTSNNNLSISDTRIYNRLYFSNGRIANMISDDLIKFLKECGIIKPHQSLVCETCNTIVASFIDTPTEDEFRDYLFEKYICNTCKNEIDYNTPLSELIDINVYSVINREGL